MIKTENVTKIFAIRSGEVRAVDGVSTEVAKGEVVVVCGPSGSGKSTFLRCLNRLEKADSGHIIIDGIDILHPKTNINKLRAEVGMVFQQFNLLTPLNVEDNIAFSLHLNGEAWNSWCDHLTDALGLRPLLKRHVDALSGGQQQRVAIARALAHKPALLLADEPTGNLDQTTSLEVMELICALAGEHYTSILMVTHSMECAAFMQRRWHLDLGQVHE